MASTNQQDLDSLLRSLTAYLPTSAPPEPHESVQTDQHGFLTTAAAMHPQHYASQVNLQQYPVTENAAISQNLDLAVPQPSSAQSQSASETSEQFEDVSKRAPATDPRTIIEWRAGLRHVSSLIASNGQIGKRIRKMMDWQHQHERQWWAGREALLEKQQARVEGDRKLDEVLRAVGAQTSTDFALPDQSAELKAYDMKVHRVSVQMVMSMSSELAAIGIPFFGTQPALIVEDKGTISLEKQSTRDGDASLTRPEHCIKRTELEGLQRRMLSHLEDMFGSD